MLLDVDEIIESDKFIIWWQSQKNLLHSYRLSCYWYFRDSKYRCKNTEEAIAIVKKGQLTQDDALVFHREERKALFWSVPENLRMDNCNLNGIPFSHHYSWVRSKESMIKKVQSWGHNKDQDWLSLVEKEFEQPFRGKDVIFQDREYITVVPYINLCMI
jgi:hypothetical protein